jgi:hypothetical protein
VSNKTDNRYGTRVYQGIMPPYWDRLDVAYPDSVTEDMAFSTKTSSSSDASPVYELMSCIRIVYTDDTKCLISSVTKTFKREESD